MHFNQYNFCSKFQTEQRGKYSENIRKVTLIVLGYLDTLKSATDVYTSMYAFFQKWLIILVYMYDTAYQILKYYEQKVSSCLLILRYLNVFKISFNLRLLEEYGSALYKTYQRMHVLFSKNKFQIACFGKNTRHSQLSHSNAETFGK